MSDWIELDRRHVWHPYTQMLTAAPPIAVRSGDGLYLNTEDGRRLLDGISSWWVNIHGHSHPRLNRALSRQAERLEHVIFAGFSHEPAARLAAELVERCGGQLPRVFYSDDGSTAVEVALKMAYQSWRHRGESQRRLFIALDEAYHGDTVGTMAVGGTALFHQAFSDLLFEVRHVATPASRRAGSRSPDLEQVLAEEGQQVAAVIVEPMLQGAGGMLIQPPEFLRQVRQLTADQGIPLIADEIFTGFGRTGRFLACEHAGVVPDLICLSKALTAGYLPLAATLASEEIYQSFLSEDRGKTFFHGHSFTGNALACAVGLESLALFDENRCLDRVGRLEELFAQRLARLEGSERVRSTRYLGGMAALEMAPRGQGGYLDDIGPRLTQAFLDRGILLRPLGDVLYFLPPYIVTDEEAHRVFDAIEEVLREI